MNALLALFAKELRDACKDRRGSLSSLMYALMGPLLVLVLLNGMIRSSLDERPVRVAAADHPVLASLLAQMPGSAVERVAIDGAGIDQALADGRIDVALEVPEDAQARLAELRPLPITLRADLGRAGASRRIATLRAALETISAQTADARLVARGVDPRVARPLQVSLADIGQTPARLRSVLGVLSLFLLLAPFFSSMNVLIDMTAGERERQGLEPLLSQPIAAHEVLLGKYAVGLLFGLAGVALTTALTWLLLQGLPLYELPARIALEGSTWLAIGLALVPLTCLAVAAQMAVAWHARNYKEAQIYLTLLAFSPAVVAMAATLGSGELPLRPLPILAEIRLIDTLLSGGALPAGFLLRAALVELALLAAILWASTRRLRDERLLAVH